MEQIKGIIKNQMSNIIREEIKFWEESIIRWRDNIKTMCNFIADGKEHEFYTDLDYLKDRIQSLEIAHSKLKEATKNFYKLQSEESTKKDD